MNETGIYQPFSRLFCEFERAREFAPRVDVEEDDSQYRIHADLPGADKNDVCVQLENNILSIGAKIARRGENIVRGERQSGEFKRSFQLPRRTDAEGIAASMKNGVLTVVVPKPKSEVGRKIEVR